MKAEPYLCTCGSTQFIRFAGDKRIYCKQCRKQVPANVMFKEEFENGASDSHVL